MAKRAVFGVVAFAVVVVGALNYGIWLKESLDLGGNALSGEVRDGHSYVANKCKYVEVTPAQWQHSRIHTLSLFVTQPLMLVALGYLAWAATRRRRRWGT